MPFGILREPSLGLTRLKAALERKFQDRVSTQILYLKHDFASYLGVDLYRQIISVKGLLFNTGDWFFRNAVFPDLPDNTDDFFKIYSAEDNSDNKVFKKAIHEKQKGLGNFLEELIIKYQIDKADLVGFTSIFYQNMASFAMSKKIKERNINTITVMGGSNCDTVISEEILKNIQHIDFTFRGSALDSFPNFIQHCLNNETDKCHTIDGVFSKRNINLYEHGYIDTIGRETDIDDFLPLDYDDFLDSLEKILPGTSPVIPFETSRGCWWRDHSPCIFCSDNRRVKFKSMSPEKAIEQFNYLMKKYACKSPSFMSVDNIMPKNYPKEVFPFTDIPSDIDIFYTAKSNLSADDLKSLSKAKITNVTFGIESLSTSTLKFMRKGATAFQNLGLMKNCLMYDVYPLWNLLVEFPGEENAEDVYLKYLNDIPDLTHLPPPSGVFRIKFERGSHYFNNAKKFGLNLKPVDSYELIYPFKKEKLEKIAFYFQNYNSKKPSELLYDVHKKCMWWWSLWYGKTNNQKSPQLFFNHDSNSIFDSRSGNIIEHKITNDEKQILEYLTTPKNHKKILENFGLPDLVLKKNIASLKDKGLIFQERNVFISLVCSEEPPPMTFKNDSPVFFA
jgi:ribosomal peptide maturation radical SAM protein 1